jgi:hypothetical protein
MKKLFSLSLLVFIAMWSFGQQFEPALDDGTSFEKLKVNVGAGFALQIQGLSHEAPDVELIDLKKNVNLPTANFNLGADLAPGISVLLETYLSSRHHNEAWVKGGYLVLDRMPFLRSDNFMDNLTIIAGVMMPNYGDAHFYRSDNGNVIQNPFVGNWIMDAFTTNPGFEVLWRKNNIIALLGTNNGRLNFGSGGDLIEDLVWYWKVGYDNQINDELRVRATVSGYHVPDGHVGSYLYRGDRAGARYYDVMDIVDENANDFSGRWDPGSQQSKMNNIMVNVFVKYSGLEVFGLYENSKGIRREVDQHFTQYAIQPIYRMGSFYAGLRYNGVIDNDGGSVERWNIGGGWFMNDYVLMKLEYVDQTYYGAVHGLGAGAKFNGFVLETAIQF